MPKNQQTNPWVTDDLNKIIKEMIRSKDQFTHSIGNKINDIFQKTIIKKPDTAKKVRSIMRDIYKAISEDLNKHISAKGAKEIQNFDSLEKTLKRLREKELLIDEHHLPLYQLEKLEDELNSIAGLGKFSVKIYSKKQIKTELKNSGSQAVNLDKNTFRGAFRE